MPVTRIRPQQRALAILLLTNLLFSAVHFADNMLRFEHYPEPKWITGPHIVGGLWVGITLLLALGWWLAQRERRWQAIGILWVYGALSALSLGHYLYGPPHELTFGMNAMIIASAGAGLLLIVFAPRLVTQR